jgi:hypothetical protein
MFYVALYMRPVGFLVMTIFLVIFIAFLVVSQNLTWLVKWLEILRRQEELLLFRYLLFRIGHLYLRANFSGSMASCPERSHNGPGL